MTSRVSKDSLFHSVISEVVIAKYVITEELDMLQEKHQWTIEDECCSLFSLSSEHTNVVLHFPTIVENGLPLHHL